ncbi:MAG: hypothetical protein AAF961_04180 [Planctomycetota bacterium]
MSTSTSRWGWGLLACIAEMCLTHGNAWAQHSDILLAGRTDGQLAVVGEASVFAGSFGTPFVDDQGLVHVWTTNPGFASLNAAFLPDQYAPLPPLSDLSFSILSFPIDGLPPANLWYWDGVDQGGNGDYLEDVAFAPLDTGSAFRVYWGPVQRQLNSSGIADGGASDQPGFSLGRTSQGGGLHIHPGYEVFGTVETPPDPGVYLVSLGLQIENLEDSQPLYFVLRTGGIEVAAVAAARTWVHVETQFDTTMTADFDVDGDVDGADLLLWQRGETGDALSQQDLAEWEANFGRSTGVEIGPPAAMPEPATAILLMAAFGLLRLAEGLRMAGGRIDQTQDGSTDESISHFPSFLHQGED